jgi:hypothetical protein
MTSEGRDSAGRERRTGGKGWTFIGGLRSQVRRRLLVRTREEGMFVGAGVPPQLAVHVLSLTDGIFEQGVLPPIHIVS